VNSPLEFVLLEVAKATSSS
jgi:hypothetical protein